MIRRMHKKLMEVSFAARDENYNPAEELVVIVDEQN